MATIKAYFMYWFIFLIFRWLMFRLSVQHYHAAGRYMGGAKVGATSQNGRTIAGGVLAASATNGVYSNIGTEGRHIRGIVSACVLRSEPLPKTGELLPVGFWLLYHHHATYANTATAM